MYRAVTEGEPVDANDVLGAFTPAERERIAILTG